MDRLALLWLPVINKADELFEMVHEEAQSVGSQKYLLCNVRGQSN